VSNNIKSIDYFIRSLNPIMGGKLFHQKCAFHIKTLGVDQLIVKFKDSLHHIYSNNVRK
jgi:hypothetical protein